MAFSSIDEPSNEGSRIQIATNIRQHDTTKKDATKSGSYFDGKVGRLRRHRCNSIFNNMHDDDTTM